MTITIDAKTLRDALNAVRPAVTARGGSLPVLRCARLDVDAMTLTATDLDVTIVADIYSRGAGTVLLPLRDTLDALKGWTGDVTIAVDGASVTLDGAAGRVTLKGEHDDEWPRFGERREVAAWSLGDVDRRALDACARAASTDDCRPILTGILMETTGKTRTYAATDSYRLDVTEYPCDDAAHTTLVPARAVRIALKLGATEHASIGWDGAHGYMLFSGAGRYVLTRAIDGDFPNYRGLLPKDPPYGTRLDAAELRDACAAAVKLNGKDGAAPIRLEQMTAAGAQLRCTVEDRGELLRTLGETHDQGACVAYNPRYLLDALHGIDGPATLRFSDALKPMTVTTDDEPHRVALLMPVRVDGQAGTGWPVLDDAPAPAPKPAAPVAKPRRPRAAAPVAPVPVVDIAPEPTPEPAAPAATTADGPASLPTSIVEWLDRLVFADKRAYAHAWAEHVVCGADAPADPGTDWAAKARSRCARVLAHA